MNRLLTWRQLVLIAVVMLAVSGTACWWYSLQPTPDPDALDAFCANTYVASVTLQQRLEEKVEVPELTPRQPGAPPRQPAHYEPLPEVLHDDAAILKRLATLGVATAPDGSHTIPLRLTISWSVFGQAWDYDPANQSKYLTGNIYSSVFATRSDKTREIPGPALLIRPIPRSLAPDAPTPWVRYHGLREFIRFWRLANKPK